MALTFGTLLSSQIADAHETLAFRPSFEAASHVSPHNGQPPKERPAGPGRGLARRREKVTSVRGAVSNR